MTPPVRGVHHLALWAEDLERVRAFYVDVLGARCGAAYVNPVTGFRSCFVEFGDATRIEIMSRADVVASDRATPRAGYAHVALSVGSRDAVDAWARRLESLGITVASAPRQTGDGYYEAVVLDPEGNRIEIVA